MIADSVSLSLAHRRNGCPGEHALTSNREAHAPSFSDAGATRSALWTNPNLIFQRPVYGRTDRHVPLCLVVVVDDQRIRRGPPLETAPTTSEPRSDRRANRPRYSSIGDLAKSVEIVSTEDHIRTARRTTGRRACVGQWP